MSFLEEVSLSVCRSTKGRLSLVPTGDDGQRSLGCGLRLPELGPHDIITSSACSGPWSALRLSSCLLLYQPKVFLMPPKGELGFQVRSPFSSSWLLGSHPAVLGSWVVLPQVQDSLCFSTGMGPGAGQTGQRCPCHPITEEGQEPSGGV